MTNQTGGTAPDIDPDPFGIGIGVFAAMVSGVSFLETRRQTQFLQQQQRATFRAAWFQAKRSVIYFKRSVDEFETYILEEGFGARSFRVGAVRLTVAPQRAHELKRLRGQALVTANRIGDDLDELSNFLGPDDQAIVTSILTTLNEFGTFPERYVDLVTQGRAVVGLYTELLDSIDGREGFSEETASYTSG